jgi:hypothetical protein
MILSGLALFGLSLYALKNIAVRETDHQDV